MESSVGLPQINFNFVSKAVTAIARSQRGIVALILKDTGDFDTKEYKNVAEIVATDWTESNKDYIEKAFIGVPSKVIVERIDVDETDYNVALARLANKRFNYLAIPGIEASKVTNISSWLIAQRDQNNKSYKAVLSSSEADHEGVINFTTGDIVVGAKTYSASEYTARIAGILAGLSLERSATYYVLPEVESIEESVTPDDDVDAGQLILINDGEKIKIGSGVNSLVTTTVTKNDEYKKIKIIEGHDLVRDDIVRSFEDDYVGKVNNSYDNQSLYFAAVNSYIKGLEGEVLNPNVINLIEIDIEAQAQAWESIGTDTSGWTEQQIKDNTFRNQVFVTGSLRFLDAMEDINFKVNV